FDRDPAPAPGGGFPGQPGSRRRRRTGRARPRLSRKASRRRVARPGGPAARAGVGIQAGWGIISPTTFPSPRSRSRSGACCACPESIHMTQKITVIRGDGIGPEIMDATLHVLDQLDAGLEYEFADAGVVALEKHGDLMPKETLDSIARNKVALKSPLTTPVGGGFTSINVSLRRHFDLYANVRPAISFPNTRARYENIDLITVRE